MPFNIDTCIYDSCLKFKYVINLILSGGGHYVGLAFEDAVLIARLIEHLKPNNIHEVSAFYGTSSTID